MTRASSVEAERRALGGDHAAGHRAVGVRVDQDEGAGVLLVAVEDRLLVRRCRMALSMAFIGSWSAWFHFAGLQIELPRCRLAPDALMAAAALQPVALAGLMPSAWARRAGRRRKGPSAAGHNAIDSASPRETSTWRSSTSVIASPATAALRTRSWKVTIPGYVGDHARGQDDDAVAGLDRAAGNCALIAAKASPGRETRCTGRRKPTVWAETGRRQFR